ncbi:hypothetical protein EJ06DRAFT_420307 [Trichodelitschia bisporula]|uniref:CorA-like transporter domain-containing protein n=1 Tax=Trichodelitschia bisporula TaxID=703511 RepID=A0A6G1HW81_9PEZI|nr:hypothetical protein EJ06DRAFT_420307 [Trichodelitschia bisporula]
MPLCSPLEITRKMMTRIFTYHQVMPSYLDFVLVFGSQNEFQDLRVSGFREQVLLAPPERALSIPGFGRSGCQYQLCYNLKSVGEVTPEDGPEVPAEARQWNIRQAAFHHQFDVLEGTAVWIVTESQHDVQDLVKEMAGELLNKDPKAFSTLGDCFRTSLSTHLLCCQWAAGEWRWYIQWIEGLVHQEIRLGNTSAEFRGRRNVRNYTTDNLQNLQFYEDRTKEIGMVLESNVDVMSSLRSFYEGLLGNRDVSLGQGAYNDVRSFAAQVNDVAHDLNVQIKRAQLLATQIADGKRLVLQHLQSQATERIERLTQSSLRLAGETHKMGPSSQKESLLMRVVAIVVLIFLPATFVSTFFSTDVVRYQPVDGSGSFSRLALQMWFAVAIPLIFLSLSAGCFGLLYAKRKQRRNTQDSVEQGNPEKFPGAFQEPGDAVKFR